MSDASALSTEELLRIAGVSEGGGGPLGTSDVARSRGPQGAPGFLDLLAKSPTLGLRGDTVNPVQSFPESDAELALGAAGALGGPIGSRFTRGFARAGSAGLRRAGLRPNLFKAAVETGESIPVDALAKATTEASGRAGTPGALKLAQTAQERLTGPAASVSKGSLRLPIKDVDDLRQMTGEAVTRPATRRTGRTLRAGVERSLDEGGLGAAMLQQGTAEERALHALLSKPGLRELLGLVGLGGAGFGMGGPGGAAAALSAPRLWRLFRATPGDLRDRAASYGLSRALSNQPGE